MKNNVNFRSLRCAVALCYGNAYAQISLRAVEESKEPGICEENKESLSRYEGAECSVCQVWNMGTLGISECIGIW